MIIELLAYYVFSIGLQLTCWQVSQALLWRVIKWHDKLDRCAVRELVFSDGVLGCCMLSRYASVLTRRQALCAF